MTVIPLVCPLMLPIWTSGNSGGWECHPSNSPRASSTLWRPRSKTCVYSDAGLPGLSIRLHPKAGRSSSYCTGPGVPGRGCENLTIGPYGRVTLPMARAQAQKIFAARLDGRDLAAEKTNSRRRQVADRVDGLVETLSSGTAFNAAIWPPCGFTGALAIHADGDAVARKRAGKASSGDWLPWSALGISGLP